MNLMKVIQKKNAFHIYAENESAVKRNDTVLNDLPGDLYTIQANDKIPDKCKHPIATTHTAQYQEQTITEGLGKLLQLKIGAKLMRKVNLDIQDRLIASQTGNTTSTEFTQGSV